MNRRRRARCLAASLAICSLTALSACSSSGGSKNTSTPPTSSGGSTGQADVGVTAAKAYVAKYSKKSTDIGIDVPLTSKPASGKVVYTVNVQNPLAVEQVVGIQAAAKVLGWTVKPLYWTTNPTDANKQILQAVQAKADFIEVNGVPQAVISQGVAAAKAAKIPIFLAGSVTEAQGAANWTFASVNSGTRFANAGKVAADYIIAETNGDANVLNADIAGFDVQTAQTDGFVKELKANCPKCKYSHVGVPIADLGTPGKPASDAVAYIRAHPGINQLVFGAGGMTGGIATALTQAGLKGVTVTSINGLTTNLVAIGKGEEQATVSEGLPYLGWVLVDAMARYSEKMDISPNWKIVNPEFIQTKDSISGPDDEFTGPADYQASFQKLWQVSG